MGNCELGCADHYFFGGGWGVKNFPLPTFFNLCTSANIVFRNANYAIVLLYISCLQTVYFVFLGPANNFFNIFQTAHQKIMVRLLPYSRPCSATICNPIPARRQQSLSYPDRFFFRNPSTAAVSYTEQFRSK